jgi:hypothetical protein
MNTSELKSGLHQLIDQVNNDYVLEDLYLDLKKIIQISSSGLLNTLSEDQKKELMLSILESDDDSNLLTNDEVMSRYKNGLSNKVD